MGFKLVIVMININYIYCAIYIHIHSHSKIYSFSQILDYIQFDNDSNRDNAPPNLSGYKKDRDLYSYC